MPLGFAAWTQWQHQAEGLFHTSPAAVLILQVFLCRYFLLASGCALNLQGFELVVHVDK